MDAKLYAEISAQWIRPCHYRNPFARMKLVRKIAARYFKDRHVIDVGCNAGLLAFEISRYAQSLIALEIDPHFYEHARVTRRHITIRNKFLNISAGEFCQRVRRNVSKFQFDALFACRVLYHLSRAEIEALQDVALPRVERLVCVSKDDKVTKLEKNGQFLWKRDCMIAWMRKNGFTTKVVREQGPSAYVLGKRK